MTHSSRCRRMLALSPPFAFGLTTSALPSSFLATSGPYPRRIESPTSTTFGGGWAAAGPAQASATTNGQCPAAPRGGMGGSAPLRADVGEDGGGLVGVGRVVERRVPDELVVHDGHRQPLEADPGQRPVVREPV